MEVRKVASGLLSAGPALALLVALGVACGRSSKMPTATGDCSEVSCAAAAGSPSSGGNGNETGGAAPSAPSAELICNDGERTCRGSDVYLCVEHGTALLLLTTCSENEVCSSTTHSCTSACEPGELGCSLTRVARCSDDGSAWEETETDCAEDESICVDGACRGKICQPNASFCQDNAVLQCDSTGYFTTIFQDCDASFYCKQFSSYAACVWSNCTPGSLVCDGNAIRTCNEVGDVSGDATPCSDTEYCRDGACHEVECEPYARVCKENALYECDHLGGVSIYVEECPLGHRCGPFGNEVACVPVACEAGATVCLENKVGVCAPDHSGLATTTQDCAAQDMVCSIALGCEASVVDAFEGADQLETLEDNSLIGNFIDAHSSRTLVQLELGMVLAAPRQLRFFMFEQLDRQQLSLREVKLVDAQASSGFLSSGALDWMLEAGKRYLLAVELQGGSAVVFYGAPDGAALSFGRRVYSAFGYAGSSDQLSDYGLDDTRLYQMRMTTSF